MRLFRRRVRSGHCPQCGLPLDEHEHDRDVQFFLPDPVLDLPDRERTTGTWMNGGDPGASVFMQVPDAGPFVRCLLPIQMTGGYSVTFGVWLSVPPDTFNVAIEVWWDESRYPSLVLEGCLANALPLLGFLGAHAVATVTEPDQKPVITSSGDDGLAAALTREWPHEELLAVLPRP